MDVGVELQRIYGIGPEMAGDLIKSGKIRPGAGTVRSQLKKIKKQLPKATRADLKYNPSRKIPYEIIKDIDRDLKRRLKGIKYEIAGSFRRKLKTSRDLDLIISKGNQNKLDAEDIINKINHRNSKFQIVHLFAKGDSKISAIMKYNRDDLPYGRIHIKMDIFITDASEYLFMLLFATGSGKFNIRMRSIAKRHGYLLNQRGLYKREGLVFVPVEINTERELFDLLGIKYLEPSKRFR